MFLDDDAPSRRPGRAIPWGSDEPPSVPDEPRPGGGEDPPPSRPEWRGRDVVLGIVLLGVGYVALLVAFTIIAIARGIEEGPDVFTLDTVLVLLLFEVWLGAIVLWLARRRGMSLRDLGFVMPARWRYIPIALFFSYAAIVLWSLGIEAVDRYVDRDLSGLTEGNPIPTDDYSFLLWAVLGVSIVVLAPLSEELFFRGLLYRALALRWAPSLAMLVSGVAFSLVHFNVSVFVPFVVIGIVLAWSYTRSQSLWTPIIVHAIVNGFSFILIASGVEA